MASARIEALRNSAEGITVNKTPKQPPRTQEITHCWKQHRSIYYFIGKDMIIRTGEKPLQAKAGKFLNLHVFAPKYSISAPFG